MAFGKDVDPEIGKDTQFKEGNNANPNGRGGIPSFKTVLRKYLSGEIDVTDPITQKKMKVTVQDALMLKKIQMALKDSGNLNAINSIEDRMDGKATQMMGSDPDNPVSLTIENILSEIADDAEK